MKDDKMKIEQRLGNMKNFYIKAGEMIDKLPDAIPEKTRIMLKETILGDNDLKKLMEGIDSHRPPRIFLIGSELTPLFWTNSIKFSLLL